VIGRVAQSYSFFFPRSKMLSVEIFLLGVLLLTNADKINYETLNFNTFERKKINSGIIKNVECLLHYYIV